MEAGPNSTFSLNKRIRGDVCSQRSPSERAKQAGERKGRSATTVVSYEPSRPVWLPASTPEMRGGNFFFSVGWWTPVESLSHSAHALHVPIALLKTASFSLSPPLFSDNNTESARGIHRFPVAILDCVSLRPRHQIVPEHFQTHRQALIFIELCTSADSLIISIDNTVM